MNMLESFGVELSILCKSVHKQADIILSHLM